MNVLISIRQPVLAWAIPPSHVELLRQRFPHIVFTHALDEHADLEGIGSAEVAFTWTMTNEMLARASRLRWVHSSAAAVGTLPLAMLGARGVMVTNSRGIQSAPIAEHVISVMLALSRRLPFALQRQAARVWAQNEMIGRFTPALVHGRRMGIIGLGSIGQAVAVRAAALGMKVTAVRRRPEQGPTTGVETVVGPALLDDVLAQTDVIVLAAPWTSATDRVLGVRELRLLQPTTLVINVARGQLVDEAALAEALSAGRIGGAALDVFTEEPLPVSSPFWGFPNVIITPHTSGFRDDHWDAVIDLFSDNLRRFEFGQTLLNAVDCEAGY